MAPREASSDNRLARKTVGELNQLVGEAVTRLQHKITRYAIKPRDFGTGELMTRVEVELITFVVRFPELSVTDIANRIGMTKSGVSQLASALEVRGYLVREISPHHARVRFLRATEKGLIVYQKINEYFSLLCGSLEGISKAELAGFLRVADRVEAFVNLFAPEHLNRR